ncbi:hypothetical protein QO002_003539 [Pararhizobium capsulatum DSM 1112]|uniref:Uncharacterized protein n=1 Tax=Pararhizobium capsulatum DSM 1112 TaxID=1121113 RepID=A0ABU0BT17_9HYPH|nr:hypothetical protein [Pararhizobium capsulatum]MDQ0321401.1 hypothetical protein [Pararhizobium capsulatum DSM 1112]
MQHITSYLPVGAPLSQPVESIVLPHNLRRELLCLESGDVTRTMPTTHVAEPQ